MRQTQQELIQRLDEQLGYIRVSAAAFDQGAAAEAQRLATTIRVLVHSKRRRHNPSVSLLSQLSLIQVPFVDTADPLSNPLPELFLFGYSGLVRARIPPDRVAAARYVPKLDEMEGRPARQIKFEDWWNQIVLGADRKTLRRRDLVLTAADQDGGAHVDPELEPVYALFARQFPIGLRVSNRDTRLYEGVVGASIRQIAHEICLTLAGRIPG